MIIWERETAGHWSGERGKLGSIHCFSLYWDAMLDKGQDEPYKLTCKLPGIKDVIGHFESQDDAKKTASGVVSMWIKKTGLCSKD